MKARTAITAAAPRIAVAASAIGILAAPALAESSAQSSPKGPTCPVSHSALRSALAAAVQSDQSGLKLQMWATVVNRDGVVCAVAFTGTSRGSQWPGSRVISAQKANTANAFSLDGLSLSTANLYSAVQPGGSLFGLQESNPVDTKVAYGGNAAFYGQPNDPMVDGKIGGVNVFGGGLALYSFRKQVIGAIGVSGDTSCRDHNVAWIARRNLRLDFVPGGVSGDPARPDNIIFDINPEQSELIEGKRNLSPSGFGHPKCIATGDPAQLPPIPVQTAGK